MGFVLGNKGSQRIPGMLDILSGSPALEAGKARSSVGMWRSMRGFIISPRHRARPPLHSWRHQDGKCAKSLLIYASCPHRIPVVTERGVTHPRERFSWTLPPKMWCDCEISAGFENNFTRSPSYCVTTLQNSYKMIHHSADRNVSKLADDWCVENCLHLFWSAAFSCWFKICRVEVQIIPI